MDTLAFGYILPTTGRIPDLHWLETCAAGRTMKCRMQRAYNHLHPAFLRENPFYSAIRNLVEILFFEICLYVNLGTT